MIEEADGEMQHAHADKEFILDKVIEGGCGNSTSYLSRKVKISNNLTQGKLLEVFSKDGTTIKSKNQIILFMDNPIILIEPLSVNNKISVMLKRESSTPIILTSDNELLTEMFISYITTWINVTNFLYVKLHRWTDCYQNQMIKCINSLHLQNSYIDVCNKRSETFESSINTISKKNALNAIRYLGYVLENGKYGLQNLLREYFNIWLIQWNRLNIRYYIKVRHDIIKQKLCFFNSIPHQSSNTFKYKNNLNDMYEKLTHINAEFTSIYNNIITYTNKPEITEVNQKQVVNNLQKMAALRHHIQSITHTGEEFILVGDQSSGKSSLLCTLLGVNIAYTDNVFATRCPVRYLLEPCDPKIGWKYEYEDPQTKVYMIVSQEELQKKLITHFKSNLGKIISFDPINIKIWSPICTSSMTLVDLPGLVGLSDSKDKNEQHNNSYSLVRKYINKPNVFILFVHRFDVDIGSLNTNILDEIKSINHTNVIYCLTHFDRCCIDSDITYHNIYDTILQCSSTVANGNDMFLLSLSKNVGEIQEKEQICDDTIKYLRENYDETLSKKGIHFNVSSIKTFLRNKIHKHVLEIHTVIHNYLNAQKYIINTEFNIYNSDKYVPRVTEIVLDTFITQFKAKTQKLLKGHLIPLKNSHEEVFFENLNTEVKNANIYANHNSVAVWPASDMIRLDISSNLINFENGLDPSLRRDLASHALFTRTIYELKMRLCSINIQPTYEDIVHGITYDPNINLDTPKDCAHNVMLYTVQRQLDMSGFFNYAIKRLEYVFYKIIRYSIWSVMTSPDLPLECCTLMEKDEFQQMFEIEIHAFVDKLCNHSRTCLVSSFDEIMSSPIVLSHTSRYKEMLINDFGWTDENIEKCYDENIFRPKNIGVHNKDNESIAEQADSDRINKIQNLIKLHIHVRLLMICERIAIHVDYNWRRMLDDSKESTIREKSAFIDNVFEHIKHHVCKGININNTVYDDIFVKKLYSGTLNDKIDINPEKIADINRLINSIDKCNVQLPETLAHAVYMAGDKFL